MTTANFAYIDDVMDKAIEAQSENTHLSKSEKESAHLKSRKIIGGFRVKDASAEQRELDALVQKRMATIDAFKVDRKSIRDTLAKCGVTPLAVCPTKAWYKLCRQSGLFIFHPNEKGQIGLERGKFSPKDLGMKERAFNEKAEKNWSWFLESISKDGIFPKAEISNIYHGRQTTGLVLPDPPEDVANVLVKVQSLNPSLKVATVPGAVRFTNSPYEIAQSSKYSEKDLWAQAQGYEDYADWIKRDPIVFIEHRTATAVIAQFGDFPIEREAVDQVVKADGWLSDQVSTEVQSIFTPDDPVVARYLAQAEAQRQREIAAGPQWTDLFGGNQSISNTTNPIYNSALWTGRLG